MGYTETIANKAGVSQLMPIAKRGYWSGGRLVRSGEDNAVPKTFGYVMECAGFVKVGLSSNVPKRLRQIEAQCPLPVRVVFKIGMFAHVAGDVEHETHKALAEHHHHDEWFTCSPEVAVTALRRVAGRYRYTPAPEGWRLAPCLYDRDVSTLGRLLS